MHRYIAILLLAIAPALFAENLHADGFEDMADTGWITTGPNSNYTVNGVVHAFTDPENKLANTNDELFETMAGVIGTYSGTEDSNSSLILFEFDSLVSLIPSGGLITGIEARAAIAANAVDDFGNVIDATPEEMAFVDSEVRIIFFDADLGYTQSGSVGQGSAFAYGLDGVPVGDSGVDFEMRYWGGAFDGWPKPSIPSYRDSMDPPPTLSMRVVNNGPYQLKAYVDLAQIKIHYIVPADTVVMTGSGTVTTTATLRGKTITSAMAGSGNVAVAANGVSATRQVASTMVGSGLVTSSVRLDDAGTIHVYGFANLAGSGTVAVANPTRVLPIGGVFVGSGAVAATTLRGKPGVWSDDENGRPPGGNFKGSGSVNATPWRIRRLTSALAGSGAVVALVNKVQLITSALVGSGTVAASTFVTRQVSAALIGSGTVVASVLRGRGQAVAMVGAGVVSAVVRRGIRLVQALIGSGTVTASVDNGTRDPAPEDRAFDIPQWDAEFDVPEAVYLFDGGTNSMGIIGKVFKQPAEVVDFDVLITDYFAALASAGYAADAVSTATAVVARASAGATSDLLLGPSLSPPRSSATIIADDRVKGWCGAGISGRNYTVTVTMTTVAGRILEEDVLVIVKEVV